MRLSTLRASAVVVCTAVPMIMVMTTPATAAAPSNDNRADAQVVGVPAKVTGTTVDATTETGERRRVCDGQTSASVWYRFTGTDERGVVAKLAAHGNLDAEIDIYKQRRSQLEFVACDLTDDRGLGAAGFRVTDGATYFLRVAERHNSEANSFTLNLLQGPPPAEPPGRSLASGHAKGRLDRVLKVDAAYHLHLSAGTPYRFNLVHNESDCQKLALFPPGTSNFETATPVLSRRCGGYAVYAPAPGDGGRYFIRITADRSDREAQPYRLLAGPAQPDDIAPGIRLRNHPRNHRKGSVNGATLDVKDVYRFSVVRHSNLDLHLVGRPGHNLQLELRNYRGKQIDCACDPGSHQSISLRIRPGRYFVAVLSADLQRTRYTLTRKSRTITATTTNVNGRRRVTVRPHQAVDFGVTVRPGATGSALLNIEHFDPFQGWLPYRQRRVNITGGQGNLDWTPPTVGRWRAQTDYLGTRNFAPSQSDYARVLVANPLSATTTNALAMTLR
jgi:hypothetical protein